MMKTMHKNIYYGSLLLCSLCGMTSCIDEDLSDCPPPAKEVEITYQLEVAQDVTLGFSDEVNSLHLGFWTAPDALFRERMLDKEDLPEDMLFSVTLPVDNYSHVAIANGEQNDGSYNPYPQNIIDAVASVDFISPDTVTATATPMYAGKLQMNMGENFEHEHYEVLMEPVSAKYILHVNRPETLKNTRCFIQGTKEAYACWEQLWINNSKLVTDASAFSEDTESGADFTFYAFPTYTPQRTKAVEMQDGWFKVYFYSELNDKIVQHIFTVKETVGAGKVFEATFNITEQGGEAVDVTAGVEIDTDWEPGSDFETDM